jgi:hypothetical protein
VRTAGTRCHGSALKRAGRPGRGAWVQAGGVAVVLPELSSPLADRHPTDAQSAGTIRLPQRASLQQAASCQTASFTVTASKLFRSPYHRHLS